MQSLLRWNTEKEGLLLQLVLKRSHLRIDCYETNHEWEKILQIVAVSSCLSPHPPENMTYDPIYKVKEFMDYLQSRFTQLFEPSQELSLDETLIRTFGHIKF